MFVCFPLNEHGRTLKMSSLKLPILILGTVNLMIFHVNRLHLMAKRFYIYHQNAGSIYFKIETILDYQVGLILSYTAFKRREFSSASRKRRSQRNWSLISTHSCWLEDGGHAQGLEWSPGTGEWSPGAESGPWPTVSKEKSILQIKELNSAYNLNEPEKDSSPGPSEKSSSLPTPWFWHCEIRSRDPSWSTLTSLFYSTLR